VRRIFPLYLATAELAHHLIEMLRRGEAEELRQVFALVERLLIEGDEQARNLVCVGLLEDIQNGNLHMDGLKYGPTQPEDFRPYLHARSLECWEYLYRFWSNVQSGSLADAIRFEAGDDEPLSKP
jgi:hypothetical protein